MAGDEGVFRNVDLYRRGAMTRRWRTAGVVLAFAAAVPARPASPSGYAVMVTAGDVVVRRGDGGIAFSARAFAAAEDAALKAARAADLVTVRHRFAVVALAGPLLGLRDEVAINLDAPIPGGSIRLWTIDLRQPATYRFDDEEPLRPLPGDKTLLDLRTLVAAPALAAAIGMAHGAPAKAKPRDLRTVLSDLSRRGMVKPNCFAADADVLSSFAVVGRTATRVRVRIGLPGQPWCRDTLTPLDIDLPNRGALAAAVGGPVTLGPPGTAVVAGP